MTNLMESHVQRYLQMHYELHMKFTFWSCCISVSHSRFYKTTSIWFSRKSFHHIITIPKHPYHSSSTPKVWIIPFVQNVAQGFTKNINLILSKKLAPSSNDVTSYYHKSRHAEHSSRRLKVWIIPFGVQNVAHGFTKDFNLLKNLASNSNNVTSYYHNNLTCSNRPLTACNIPFRVQNVAVHRLCERFVVQCRDVGTHHRLVDPEHLRGVGKLLGKSPLDDL